MEHVIVLGLSCEGTLWIWLRYLRNQLLKSITGKYCASAYDGTMRDEVDMYSTCAL